ncbi:Ryanodine receptor 2 [Liparis tanakae]|uniref:Ryanodine receptor 2 n=1 Tax=Liparis tanakae TaxID=230148 RepID=A0A4Z2HAA0_9TELE|nr:Ryanodine receptor 2 [Liparis tanakae]
MTVEPSTKLFPAVFAKATSPNVFQFELGRIKNVMPLSAGLFKSERKNPVPQCPPRLHVQFLTPVLWSRVPNHFLKVQLHQPGSLCFYFGGYISSICKCIEQRLIKADCCTNTQKTIIIKKNYVHFSSYFII